MSMFFLPGPGWNMGKLTLDMLLAVLVIATSNALTSQGCDDGWLYNNNYCYSFNIGVVHFDTAKAVCLSKGSHLASLWSPEEDKFVEKVLWHNSVDRDTFAWIGLMPTGKGKGWMWLDGSMFDRVKYGIPTNTSNLCGTIQGKGALGYMDCDDTMSAFVCKKALVMVFVSSDFYNHTKRNYFFDDPPKSLLFERLWPPRVQKFPAIPMVLASVLVLKETDCAYRCFRVDDCRAFTMTCESSRKCNKFNCKLIS